eukprot:superscaffoldBa00007120_g22240
MKRHFKAQEALERITQLIDGKQDSDEEASETEDTKTDTEVEFELESDSSDSSDDSTVSGEQTEETASPSDHEWKSKNGQIVWTPTHAVLHSSHRCDSRTHTWFDWPLPAGAGSQGGSLRHWRRSFVEGKWPWSDQQQARSSPATAAEEAERAPIIPLCLHQDTHSGVLHTETGEDFSAKHRKPAVSNAKHQQPTIITDYNRCKELSTTWIRSLLEPDQDLPMEAVHGGAGENTGVPADATEIEHPPHTSRRCSGGGSAALGTTQWEVWTQTAPPAKGWWFCTG